MAIKDGSSLEISPLAQANQAFMNSRSILSYSWGSSIGVAV